jgi:hypothetical protein
VEAICHIKDLVELDKAPRGQKLKKYELKAGAPRRPLIIEIKLWTKAPRGH